MDGTRLKTIGQQLFPDQNWRVAIAAYLGIDPRTISRWIEDNRVPRGLAIALEFTVDHGPYNGPNKV